MPTGSGTDENDLESLAIRFWSKVNCGDVDDCWLWQAAVTEKGYGRFRIGGRKGKAHKASRVAYYLTHGTWPQVVMHTCDNPPCVNPSHLKGGTIKDNVDDMIAKGRGRGQFKRRYSDEERNAIVERQLSGETYRSISADLGIHTATITRFKKWYLSKQSEEKQG